MPVLMSDKTWSKNFRNRCRRGCFKTWGAWIGAYSSWIRDQMLEGFSASLGKIIMSVGRCPVYTNYNSEKEDPLMYIIQILLQSLLKSTTF